MLLQPAFCRARRRSARCPCSPRRRAPLTSRASPLADRQYRDVRVCARPGRGGSNTVTVDDCPGLIDPKLTLLGFEQERWLADDGDLSRPWNLLAQQMLMARFSGQDPALPGRGALWTDGLDGYAPARNRLLGVVAKKKVPDVVELDGDVTATMSPT